jgi:GntR family transcriptional regulator/MocR family aminotransferase
MPSWRHAPAIVLDRRSHRPLPQQLVLGVIDEIRRGRLAPGDALPGTRTLARSLGVHRNTVVAAFEELHAQGWLETTRASHTRVTRSLPAADQPASRALSRSIGFAVRPWRNSARGFEATAPGVLDFTGGLPDARLFPPEVLSRAYRRSLRHASGRLLDFGSPAGDVRLRAGIAAMLSSQRALAVTADDVLVTRGSQLALHMLSLAMVRAGDTVAVESPGYPSAREAFSLLGARLLPIRVDAEGLDVAQLARALETRTIRALHVTPHHQDPTTVTLSARRRLALLALARRHRFAIVEADYDHEFQFEGAPVLPMASADRHGVVVHVGTLSKAIAPGLRMGFVVAPPPLRDALIALRGQIDRQGDHALERAVSELLEDGELQRHSLRARRVFHARRDHLAALLRRHLADALTFEVPRGGLALWARVAPGIDVERWAQAGRAAGVRFFTGRPYSPGGRTIPYVRLGFGHLDEAELGEAVRRMARAR